MIPYETKVINILLSLYFTTDTFLSNSISKDDVKQFFEIRDALVDKFLKIFYCYIQAKEQYRKVKAFK